MLRKLAILPLLACLLYPAAGLALGLGEVRVDSALNQPLEARIELTNVRAGELDALQVRLAPPESFSRVGIDRPFILTQLRFSVETDGGQPYIKVTTREEVREPFLNFLIEASWARGRLLREYTVLLDPPVMMPAIVEPVRAAQPARESTQPTTQAQATRSQRTLPTPMHGRIPDDRMRPGASEFGPVQRDDTLWSIAERAKPSADITTSQMMIALFEANPDAFYGNINNLKTGYVLRVPSRDEITRRSSADAFREAARQNEAWRSGQAVDFARVSDAGPAAGDSRLRLTAPTGSEIGTDPAGTAGADPELQRELAATRGELSDERAARSALATRLAELEAETQELRRMLEIRDAELEALTGQRPEPVQPVEVVPPVDTTPATTDEPATAVPAEEAPAEEAPAEVTPAEEAPATERPADRRRVGPAPVDEDPGLLGLLTKPLVIGGALGVLIVIAIAIAIAALRRRRAAADATDALESDADEAEEDADSDDDATVLGGGSDADADEGAETVVGGGAAAASAGAPAPVAEEPVAEEDDAMNASAVMKLDEGDPASEADFHLAYGLYDQAADLMEGAYKQHPDRVDFLMKLLEIYFAWGKPTEFIQHAREGRPKLEAAGEWANVAILGRQMSADEKLFSDMGSTGTRSGVDLDLEGGGENSGGEVDLDTGEFESEFDLGEPESDAPAEPAAEAAPAGNDLEFDLGDFEYETDTGADAEPAADAPEADAPEIDAGETQAIDLNEPASESTQFKVDSDGDDGGMDLDLDAALADLEAEPDSGVVESQFADEGDAGTPAPAPEPAADDGDDLSLDFDSLLGEDAEAEGDGGGDAPASPDSRLDLARAYIDMGDADGARTLLDEVMADGDDAQKREAQELLALIS
ncbi:MAG: tetratricopeptide repeat protein [Xanthomonadaceae bacterium]|nr:tetratricopeptide repeat protein [Xanthomonadaceae bacterium]